MGQIFRPQHGVHTGLLATNQQGSGAASRFLQVVGDGVSAEEFYMMQYLEQYPDNSGVFCPRPHNGPNNAYDSPCSLGALFPLGDVVFVASVWDRVSGTITTYINGSSWVQGGRGTSAPLYPSLRMWVGYDDRQTGVPSSSGTGWDLDLDEVAFWSRPLPHSDVLAVYQSGAVPCYSVSATASGSVPPSASATPRACTRIGGSSGRVVSSTDNSSTADALLPPSANAYPGCTVRLSSARSHSYVFDLGSVSGLTGSIVFDTCATGVTGSGQFDSVLLAGRRSACGASDFRCSDSADDSCGVGSLVSVPLNGTQSGTVEIIVSGYSGALGTYALSWSFALPSSTPSTSLTATQTPSTSGTRSVTPSNSRTLSNPPSASGTRSGSGALTQTRSGTKSPSAAGTRTPSQTATYPRGCSGVLYGTSGSVVAAVPSGAPGYNLGGCAVPPPDGWQAHSYVLDLGAYTSSRGGLDFRVFGAGEEVLVTTYSVSPWPADSGAAAAICRDGLGAFQPRCVSTDYASNGRAVNVPLSSGRFVGVLLYYAPGFTAAYNLSWVAYGIHSIRNRRCRLWQATHGSQPPTRARLSHTRTRCTCTHCGLDGTSTRATAGRL